MMSRVRVLVLAFVLSSQAATNELKFEEVWGLIRSNLADVSEAELSRAAALGLLEQLGSKVQLAGTNETAGPPSGQALSKAAVYGNHFAYFRVGAISRSLPEELGKQWASLSASNQLKGAILDLRYAGGTDYQAAARTAGLWVRNDRALIRAGGAEFGSTHAAGEIKTPLAVLVNRQTAGAAEALAASLREAGAALLIGSRTAGEARLFQTFDLSTGQKLRIGTLPVEVGGKVLGSGGVSPDIQVQVSSLDERAYYQDPYLRIPSVIAAGAGTNDLASVTNRPRRFNEAELVRRHREGLDINALTGPESGEPLPRVIMDPALARAVDFLKGLAALRPPSAD